METDTEIPDIMTVTNLEVISGTKFIDFTIPATGLTLIHTGREQASTTLSMTLAGRMRPRRGRITITTVDGRAYRERSPPLMGAPIVMIAAVSSTSPWLGCPKSTV